MDNNKKAIEIWTVKNHKVYIIDYVANEKLVDITVPEALKKIDLFEIIA